MRIIIALWTTYPRVECGMSVSYLRLLLSLALDSLSLDFPPL